MKRIKVNVSLFLWGKDRDWFRKESERLELNQSAFFHGLRELYESQQKALKAGKGEK